MMDTRSFDLLSAEAQLDHINERLDDAVNPPTPPPNVGYPPVDMMAVGNELVMLLRRSKYRVEQKSKPKPEVVEKYKRLVERLLLLIFGIDENGQPVKDET